MLKKLLYGLEALVLLVVATVVGVYLYLRSGVPEAEGSLDLSGLSAPVEVWRDTYGVPQLWASSEADLFRAVGYTHARERLWQMELTRRLAEGRLSEIIGESMVETDRFMRTLGLDRAADREAELLGAEERELLQAYVDGVNAGMQHASGALPPEFLVLRFSPEPWTLRNSLEVAKAMAWDLSMWEAGLAFQDIQDTVGAERAQEIYPRYPEWAPVTTDGASPVQPVPGPPPPATPATPRTPEQVPRLELPAKATQLLSRVAMAHASNAWVISGSRTQSGKPILANDMHLALQAPSLWYLAGLHGGPLDVVGMTLPGLPFIIAGHSRNVAWGYTASMVDDADFFIEKLEPTDPTRYLTPEGWRSIETREETIRVKDGASVKHVVRSTRHGPILSDARKQVGDRVLSVRWTAFEPGRSVRAMLRMNRSRSSAELLEAMRDLSEPILNVVFADSEGNVGYQLAGRVPVRRGGDGFLPAPGWTDEADWVRFLDYEELPRSLNPPEGFIVSANNRPVGAGYPHPLGQRWGEPFRAVRLRELLADKTPFSAEAVARQQVDVRDALAVRYLPHAVRAAEAIQEPVAVEALRAWNGEARADSHAAALFYVWYLRLRLALHEDEAQGKELPFPFYAVNRILDARRGSWVDDLRTPEVETLEMIEARAMREAVVLVGLRTWGDILQIKMAHAFGSVELLDWMLGLSVGPLRGEGATNTVNAQEIGTSGEHFESAFGASQRHVVDFGDLDGAGGVVLPTGESGHPSSPHYRDMTVLWQRGQLLPLPVDREKALARTVKKLLLHPPQAGR